MDTRTRTILGDTDAGTLPGNVVVDESAYLESACSFLPYHSRAPVGVRIGAGASVGRGTVFDVSDRGRVDVGACARLTAAHVICDAAVEIGDHAVISANVVLMDTYRASPNPAVRRRELACVPWQQPRRLAPAGRARPVRIGRCAWIGPEACVLPGVSVGEGAVVAARSVVAEDVPPYTVVAGNPARVVRTVEGGCDRSVPPL